MDCRRAEELLSDHYERTLDPVRRADLDAHLSGCADCRALRAALGDVVEALRTFPLLEPPARLAQRVAAAALARPRVAAPSVLAPPPSPIPPWLPPPAPPPAPRP